MGDAARWESILPLKGTGWSVCSRVSTSEPGTHLGQLLGCGQLLGRASFAMFRCQFCHIEGASFAMMKVQGLPC